MQAAELTRKIHRISRLMHRARHHVSPQSPQATLGFDPYRGQGRILRLLHLHDGASQRDIAYTLDIRPQSLGELISKLEAAGYISKQPSENDKRVHLIYLTEAGREIAAKLNEPQVQEKIDPFSCLSDDERTQLGELLDKVNDDLAERIGEDEPPEMPPLGPGPHHRPLPPEWHDGRSPQW